jgi:hypothetical protein
MKKKSYKKKSAIILKCLNKASQKIHEGIKKKNFESR